MRDEREQTVFWVLNKKRNNKKNSKQASKHGNKLENTLKFKRYKIEAVSLAIAGLVSKGSFSTCTCYCLRVAVQEYSPCMPYCIVIHYVYVSLCVCEIQTLFFMVVISHCSPPLTVHSSLLRFLSIFFFLTFYHWNPLTATAVVMASISLVRCTDTPNNTHSTLLTLVHTLNWQMCTKWDKTQNLSGIKYTQTHRDFALKKFVFAKCVQKSLEMDTWMGQFQRREKERQNKETKPVIHFKEEKEKILSNSNTRWPNDIL